jgi:hypothetical protein
MLTYKNLGNKETFKSVIISLTTIPDRVDLALWDQFSRLNFIKQIILNLPKSTKKLIKTQNKKITVNLTPDLGPITKIFGLCLKNNYDLDQIVTIIDDDILYDLQNYEKLINSYDGKSVITGVGGFYDNGYTFHPGFWSNRVDILMGFSSYTLTIKHVNTLCEYDLVKIMEISECRQVDDDIISLIFNENDISIFEFPLSLVKSTELSDYYHIKKNISLSESRLICLSMLKKLKLV